MDVLFRLYSKHQRETSSGWDRLGGTSRADKEKKHLQQCGCFFIYVREGKLPVGGRGPGGTSRADKEKTEILFSGKIKSQSCSFWSGQLLFTLRADSSESAFFC